MDAKLKRRKEFSRSFRGYAPQQVDAFLEKTAQEMEDLRRESDDHHRQVEALHEELKAFRNRQENLEATLLQARQLSQETKANAEREAQLIVAEAELQAEKILGQAHNRLAQIHEDIAELKRQRVQFEVRLHSLVEAHLKLLDVERQRDRELSELEDKIKILRPPSS
ncbi:MAG: arabinan synthesis protein [Desulfovibrio sp.]|nr:arabinan synthesis protein [Desulfovibrio sp.]